jgi:hypothetical protein
VVEIYGVLIGGSAAILLNSERAMCCSRGGKLPKCAAELWVAVHCVPRCKGPLCIPSGRDAGVAAAAAAGGLRLPRLRFAGCHPEVATGAVQLARHGVLAVVQSASRLEGLQD